MIRLVSLSILSPLNRPSRDQRRVLLQEAGASPEGGYGEGVVQSRG